MKFEECTIEQLDAILNDLDDQRLRIKEQAQRVMLIRNTKIFEENKKARLRGAPVQSVNAVS